MEERNNPENRLRIAKLRYDLEDYAFSVYSESINKIDDEELTADRLSKEEKRYAMIRIKGRRKKIIASANNYILKLKEHEDSYFNFDVSEFNFPKFKV